MKTQLLAVLAVGLVLGAGAAHAGEDKDAKALLDKAIKAMNGEAKLAKLSTASMKGKATASEGGQEITVDLDATWRGLSQYRVNVDAQFGGRNVKGVMVLSGTQAWFNDSNKTEEAPEGFPAFLQNVLYAMRMPQLLPALKHKDYQLSLLGEVKVGTQNAVGLSIRHKDRPAVSLFFDKQNGLPLKSEITLNMPRENKDVTVEYLYSDYKDFDGIKLCSKIAIKADGKEFTMELSEIRAVEKVDDGQFDRP